MMKAACYSPECEAVLRPCFGSKKQQAVIMGFKCTKRGCPRCSNSQFGLNSTQVWNAVQIQMRNLTGYPTGATNGHSVRTVALKSQSATLPLLIQPGSVAEMVVLENRRNAQTLEAIALGSGQNENANCSKQSQRIVVPQSDKRGRSLSSDSPRDYSHILSAQSDDNKSPGQRSRRDNRPKSSDTHRRSHRKTRERTLSISTDDLNERDDSRTSHQAGASKRHKRSDGDKGKHRRAAMSTSLSPARYKSKPRSRARTLSTSNDDSNERIPMSQESVLSSLVEKIDRLSQSNEDLRREMENQRQQGIDQRTEDLKRISSIESVAQGLNQSQELSAYRDRQRQIAIFRLFPDGSQLLTNIEQREQKLKALLTILLGPESTWAAQGVEKMYHKRIPGQPNVVSAGMPTMLPFRDADTKSAMKIRLAALALKTDTYERVSFDDFLDANERGARAARDAAYFKKDPVEIRFFERLGKYELFDNRPGGRTISYKHFAKIQNDKQ
jgi:TolA-binding protein